MTRSRSASAEDWFVWDAHQFPVAMILFRPLWGPHYVTEEEFEEAWVQLEAGEMLG